MWTKEQEMAINKKDSNILVSASAGSGKTAVLVERVISTCIEQKVDIDKLLVVTFTKASASELKEKLYNAIYSKLKDNPADKFIKRQLSLISRSNITTMHSFCLDLVRSNFYILDIDPNFKICDESQEKLLKNKAVQKVIEKLYQEYNEKLNTDDINLYDVLELFSQKEDLFMEELLKIYNFSQSFPYPMQFLKESIDVYNISNLDSDLSDFEFGKNQIDECLGDLNILKKRCEKFIEKLQYDDDFLSYIDVLKNDINFLDSIILNNNISWDFLYDKLNPDCISNNPRYKGTNLLLKDEVMYFRNKVLKDSIKKMSQNICKKSRDVLLENKRAYGYLQYIFEAVKRIDENYLKLKKSKNLLDFSDIEHFALNLLVERKDEKVNKTDIAKQFEQDFYEVYTDEYQDTSYVQEAILNSISKDNNRFMVGDIKQSIYKFRQAIPDIFNQKYIAYPILENLESDGKNYKIILDKNFRSRKTVLDSINYIFEKIMSMKNGDCEYSNIETLKNGNKDFVDMDLQDYKTEINIINLNKSNKTSSEVDEFLEDNKSFEIEAIQIANTIDKLKEDFKVYDTKKKEFRNIKYKDIVILLRSAKEKSLILEKVLKERKIPVFCDTTSSLLESDEVKFVLSFLRLLDNPLQDIYLASVMYSIIGNFTLDELISIRNENKNVNLFYNVLSKKSSLESKESLSREDEVILSKINEFLELLNKFNDYKNILNVSQLITRIYKETNLYYEFSMEENSNIRKANLDMLVDFAIKFEQNEAKNLASYIDYIDNMRSKDDSTNSAKIIGENEDVVRVMTIHKSKGLEFPVVILADTSKSYNFKDKSSTILLHHKLGVGIDIVDKEYKISYPSVIKKAISSAIDMETRSEELRLLYVAMTRAKEKLIIFSTVKDYSKFKEKELVFYEKDKIDPYLISKNNSYFENIHMCLGQDSANLFCVNIINAADVLKSSCAMENTNIYEKLESINLDDIDLSDVQKTLNYEYPYKEYTESEKRISVTSLKKEKNLVANISNNISEKYSIDEVINKKITPEKRGTLTHFVLEQLDYNIKSSLELENYINQLVDKNIISNEDVKNINKDSIIEYLNSELAEKIRKSTYVRKEEEFILKDEKISLSQIQGIIDLYFINENSNIELVDFKTDRLNKDEEFIENYKVQLDTYAYALEKITGKKVEQKHIYSLYLNKDIKL